VKGDFRLISQPPHSYPLKFYLYFILSLPRPCGNITTAAATTTATTTPTTTAAALQNAIDAAVQPSV
jgi:hypothetical protein